MQTKPRIKICCIRSLEEAKLAIRYGASAIGLVGHMPSGPGIISNEMIFEIAINTPPPIATFLLTSETTVQKIIVHHNKTKNNTIQIVDALTEGTYNELKMSLPGIKIVQVIHVIDEHAVEEALHLSTQVDALLLDSGNPNLAVKELGGTGRVHNWKLSRQIVEGSKVPVFLAGGLNAENVIQAMQEVNPFGFDLCSSVRTNGHLDEKKVENFFNAVNNRWYLQ